MILNAYTLYDVKSLAYSPPFFAVSDGVAARMLSDLVGDLNTSVGRHPRDFTMYCIGVFDDATGQLLPNDVRRHIADAITLVRKHIQEDFFSKSAAANGASGSDPYSIQSSEVTEGR